jgi:hypothetical protein
MAAIGSHWQCRLTVSPRLDEPVRATDPERATDREHAARAQPLRPEAAQAHLGFGRIVASEIEAPNILVNLA